MICVLALLAALASPLSIVVAQRPPAIQQPPPRALALPMGLAEVAARFTFGSNSGWGGIGLPRSRSPEAIGFPAASRFVDQGRWPKQPVLAGTLSLLIPFGAGSFYAENANHGIAHLAVGATTLTVFLLTACFDPCVADDLRDGLLVFSLLGFVTNWIVGTVVAVLDANAFNRKLQTMKFDFMPAVLLLDAARAFRPPGPATQQFGLRLIRLSL